MPKLAPPPLVALETWRALLAAADEFATLEPWEFMFDADVVGLIDPNTKETRLAHVLGNAGSVFAAVTYRRGGVRWLLSMFNDDAVAENFTHADSMDCLKLEFVPKRELEKHDLAMLKAAGFRSAGRDGRWPMFRSAEPGWHPWHMTQAEADQLLIDLPRLIAFCRLFEEYPEAFEDERPGPEIPFLPEPLPDRPLTPEDLDWRLMLLPPAAEVVPYQPSENELNTLLSLPRARGVTLEFDCTLLPGVPFIEKGRPCFGRCSLLVEQKHGMVVGMEVQSGTVPADEAAGRSLVACLLMAKRLPDEVRIGGSDLLSALEGICARLEIRLVPASSLPALDRAMDAFSQDMLAGGGPHRL